MNLLAISEHCIFPLEEKGKRRRRRKEKKRVVREGRTGRAWATLGKVDRAKMQGSQGHIPARAQRRPLPVRREERACGKPDSLPLGGLDDPARGAQVRRERRVKRCAGTRSFSTRIRNLNMPLFRATTLSLRLSKNIQNSLILERSRLEDSTWWRGRGVRSGRQTFGNRSLEGRKKMGWRTVGRFCEGRETICFDNSQSLAD